ncbi:cysteine hydrolase [Arthrobacter bambusae]|jgi:nicotinamidase-related amidase|uniref:cysteine hydrolase family protein n=1 Tax=Arthrobacter TaxID=1663 RepID=UPI001F507ED6|nr:MULTISPECIES: isochorismatase family cysteine hydrolase [Arthrobacter]MCI0141300.1 cysteine hydrolase [Arthrobacter bambusae]UYY82153.1 cysteine hydrolase [Arthrobacter sp. YA7-1]
MIEICGKTVRDTLEELLDPATTALVVIDMQVGAVSHGGAIGDSGHDMSMMPSVVEKCGRAITAARANGVPVFHIRVENLPDGASSPAAWLRALYTAANGRPIDLGKLSAKGDPATEFCGPCMPEDGEVVITKRRPSAFIATELALLLRSQAIESVALVGVSTGGCVEATLRDAVHNDFYAVLLEDAVGAYDTVVHDAALTVMRARHDVCTLDEAIAVWETASTS